MYIAGIHIPDGRFALGTEALATSTLFLYTAVSLSKGRKAIKFAEEKGGPIKSAPTTLVGKLTTPIHGAALILPVLTYIIAVPLNGGVQPHFIARWSLPNFGLTENTVRLVRLASTLAMASCWTLFSRWVDYMGQSYATIGVRENPKVVSTGPFAIVRHPGYLLALTQVLLFAGLSWNYVPIYSFVICAVTFVIKIPIEEGLIEASAKVGADYKEYKKKVRYRLFPGIW